jgi:hypothetical protein
MSLGLKMRGERAEEGGGRKERKGKKGRGRGKTPLQGFLSPNCRK